MNWDKMWLIDNKIGDKYVFYYIIILRNAETRTGIDEPYGW